MYIWHCILNLIHPGVRTLVKELGRALSSRVVNNIDVVSFFKCRCNKLYCTANEMKYLKCDSAMDVGHNVFVSWIHVYFM